MPINSYWLEQLRGRSGESGNCWVWWLAAASALMLLAVALSWFGAQKDTDKAQHVALLGELQIGARDVSTLSLLALSANSAASTRLKDRIAAVDATLATLVGGGEHDGKTVRPADGALQIRLKDFETRWSDFKGRVHALLILAAASEAQAGKEANRARPPLQRAPPAAAPKTPARSARATDVGASAASLLNDGQALASAMDGIRVELDNQQARPTWSIYLALACVLTAALLTWLGVSILRRRLALQQSAVRADAAMLEVLRPAMRTLHIEADASALADPVALGRRLSDAILEVIGGIRTLIRTLEAATAEANNSAAVGRSAAQALAAAEQKEVAAGASLQSTARRVAAAYAVLATGAAEAQQQCSQSLDIVGIGLQTAKDSVRLAQQVRSRMQSATQRYAEIAAANNQISQSLLEIADLSTQAEVLAVRAGVRLASDGDDDVVAFANDVRSYVGSSATELKRMMELVQRVERESGDFARQLAQAAGDAKDQSSKADDGTRVLANAEIAMRELTARISSMSRLTAGSEASQLLSALDEIVHQIAESTVSARQVLDATKHAADRIENLTKILAELKPA